MAWLAGAAGPDQARGAGFDLAETAATLRIWHSSAGGLPSDSVTAVVQTRDGFIWAGTSAGLVYFDGVNFNPVKLTDSTTNNPVHVTALCEDSNGGLWIGTEQDGLLQFIHGVVQRYPSAPGLADGGVTSLAAGRDGTVWIGTKAGLDLWTGRSFETFTKRDGLPDPVVSGVNVARSGAVWITTRSGMCRYVNGHIMPYEFQTDSQGRSPEYLGVYEDRRGNLWAFGDTYLINLAEGKRFNYFRNSESASIRIWSLCEGRDGRLWIGTSGRGLFCFADNNFQPVILGENSWSYDVRAICEDHEGNLWLGTAGGGLVQLRPQSMQVLQAGQDLPAGTPTALARSAGGQIYVGMHRDGLFVGEAGKFERFGGGSLAAQVFITSICAARDGTLWAATLGDGLYAVRDGREVHLTTADGLADNFVLALCADSEGSIWAGMDDGTIQCVSGAHTVRLSVRDGLPGTAVTALIPAGAGGLWAGTRNGEILRGEKGVFSSIQTPLDWGRHAVLALQEGAAGRLWIGTAGGGLACLVNGALILWNTANGLPSDVVAGVTEDQLQNLWLATSAGIYRVNHTELQHALDTPGAAPPFKLMSGARTEPDPVAAGGTRALLSPDGEIWFATSEGVLNVNTRQSETVPSIFPVYIERAVVNNQPPVPLLRGALWAAAAPAPAGYTPLGGESSLEISFTALSYVSPDGLQFRHRLEGSDADWVNDGASRTVHYGRLPSGNYRFRVAARNAGGSWQEAAEPFAFAVPTPLWRQDWALSGYGLAVVMLVAGIVRIVSHRRLRFTLARLEQQQSLERERMRIARDMHDEMGSKLTKISFLSEHAQVDARAAGPLAQKIEAIAQTSRDLLKTMDEIVWVVNPRNDTVENLANYLSHYAVEYFQNTSIDCELRLPREIPRFALSSEMRHNLFLAFEEALNNVLKHSGATAVVVEMTVHGREFELKVTDNGRGFNPAQPAGSGTPAGRGGNGLKNMRQRLETLEGGCVVTSRPGEGATVILRLRLSGEPAHET